MVQEVKQHMQATSRSMNGHQASQLSPALCAPQATSSPPPPSSPHSSGLGRFTLRFCSTYACTLLVLWQYFQFS